MAAWAARRAYEALDHLVQDRFAINSGTAEGETRVLEHPLVQAELHRQERDLDCLACWEAEGGSIVKLRESATNDAAMMFGP